jgi:uncharacterized protein
MMTTQKTQPWMNEPWPWLLMCGPLLVIVAGVFTTWLAYTRGDALVSNDYYRQGLAVRQTIASSEYASAMGLQANVTFGAHGVKLKLQQRDKTFILPATLSMTLSHPTRAGMDQTVLLRSSSEGYYATLHVPQSGNWLVLVEDEKKTWRLLGKIVLPATELTIGDSSPIP